MSYSKRDSVSVVTPQSVRCGDGTAAPYPVRETGNELHRIQSEIVCRWRHRNQYVVVMEKLQRIQCVKGRMNNAVFKTGFYAKPYPVHELQNE
jgi:hypothetical protein